MNLIWPILISLSPSSLLPIPVSAFEVISSSLPTNWCQYPRGSIMFNFYFAPNALLCQLEPFEGFVFNKIPSSSIILQIQSIFSILQIGFAESNGC